MGFIVENIPYRIMVLCCAIRYNMFLEYVYRLLFNRKTPQYECDILRTIDSFPMYGACIPQYFNLKIANRRTDS